jgi:hypothetical protein
MCFLFIVGVTQLRAIVPTLSKSDWAALDPAKLLEAPMIDLNCPNLGSHLLALSDAIKQLIYW